MGAWRQRRRVMRGVERRVRLGGGVGGGQREGGRGGVSACRPHNLRELHVNLPQRVSWREIRMSDRRSHDCCE